MNTIHKKQQDLEKEIEQLLEERKQYNNRGLFNQERDIINEKLAPLKAELKGIKFAKEEMLKEIEEIIQWSNIQPIMGFILKTQFKELKEKLK